MILPTSSIVTERASTQLGVSITGRLVSVAVRVGISVIVFTGVKVSAAVGIGSVEVGINGVGVGDVKDVMIGVLAVGEAVALFAKIALLFDRSFIAMKLRPKITPNTMHTPNIRIINDFTD